MALLIILYFEWQIFGKHFLFIFSSIFLTIKYNKKQQLLPQSTWLALYRPSFKIIKKKKEKVQWYWSIYTFWIIIKVYQLLFGLVHAILKSVIVKTITFVGTLEALWFLNLGKKMRVQVLFQQSSSGFLLRFYAIIL